VTRGSSSVQSVVYPGALSLTKLVDWGRQPLLLSGNLFCLAISLGLWFPGLIVSPFVVQIFPARPLTHAACSCLSAVAQPFSSWIFLSPNVSDSLCHHPSFLISINDMSAIAFHLFSCYSSATPAYCDGVDLA